MGKRNLPVFWGVVLMASCLFLNGCIFDSLFRRRNNPVSSIVDPGFQMFRTPRDFDGPGSVFRVDRNGEKSPVTNINLPSHSGNESIGAIQTSGSRNFNIGFIFPYVQADIKKDSNCTLDFKIDGAKRNWLYDDELKPILKKKMAEIIPEPGCRYYVIQETISAKKIRYHFNQDSLLSIGGEAAINELTEGNAGMSWNSTAKYQLTAKYNPPFYVFYKPAMIPLAYFNQSAIKVLHVDDFNLVPVNETLSWVENENPMN